MTTSLATRAHEKVALWKMIEESGGELTETVEQWLDEVDLNLATKVDAYRFMLDELDRESDRLGAEAETLTKASRSLFKVKERLKDRIKEVMNFVLMTDELKGVNHRFKLVNGQRKLVVYDEDAIPLQFKKVVTTATIDKEALRDYIVGAGAVPGAYVEDTKQLRTYIRKGD